MNHSAQDPRIRELPRKLAGRVAPGRSLLVGIDGGAGSGKTTFARWLLDPVRATGTTVSSVHLDDFFRPVAERVGYPSPLAVVDDCDWQRLRDEVILVLRSGERAHFQLYDWLSDSFEEWMSIDTGGVALVDGVTSLRTELRDLYDLRIWLDCPRDLRMSRLIERPGGTDAEIQRWMPSEDAFVAEHAPRECAHIVLEWDDGGVSDAPTWRVVRFELPPWRGELDPA